MSRTARIASGCRRRPLVLLLPSLVLAALTSAGALAASGTTVSVHQTQELVVLLRAHEARYGPHASSAPVGVLPATTPITGERTVVPLLARRGGWLKVRLPGRPNSHSGWIAARGTTGSVTGWHIVVDTNRRRLTVYRFGRVVRVFMAVVGKPSTPTPTGEFFVEETIALPSTGVGAPFALALSARSNVLQEFEGGPGQVAVHGLMNVGGVPGTAVSHGCVRLDNDAMRWLSARIDPGAPVTITR